VAEGAEAIAPPLIGDNQEKVAVAADARIAFRSMPLIASGLATTASGAPMTDPRLDRIANLLTLKADGQYGLHDVTQRQHALQAAWQAEREGGDAALITAALLHDIGHLVHDLGANPAEHGIDDRHEELGHAFLVGWFGPEVTEPVRLHVAAKRYLCAIEADYFSKLSKDSVLSLALQGGPMAPEEVAEFAALPQAAAAVRLRRFDEAAKVKNLETPSVAHFLPYVAECLKPEAG
jgi:phosphonate degradation associated HDIG domain protein